MEFSQARRLRQWAGILGLVAFIVIVTYADPADAAALQQGGGSFHPKSLVAAVVFAAALASSIVGFAFSALAGVPLLLLFGDPLQSVTVVVACSIATQAYCVWALRRSIRWRQLLPFIAAGMPAVPAGVWLLAHTSPTRFALGLGMLITLYAAYRLWHGEPQLDRSSWWQDALVGALGGVAGGFAGFAGMLVVAWCGMRGGSKEQQRAVYQPYILAMQLEALACLRIQAPAAFSPEIFLLYMPLALVAACAGLAVFRFLSTQQFNIAVNGLLLLSGIALLGRAF